MTIKDFIAEKLSPTMADKARRHEWMMRELHEAYRWMGEFREITAFLEWLIQHERNSWRGLADDVWLSWKWYGGVPEFRNQLRQEGIPDRVNDAMREALEQLVKANDDVQTALAGIGDAEDTRALRNAQAAQDRAERKAKAVLDLASKAVTPPVTEAAQ